MFSVVVPSRALSSTLAPWSSSSLRRVDLVVQHGEQQRRESGFGFGLHIRAELDQTLDRRRIALAGGPHQRGLTFVGLDGIHLRAVVQQHLDRVHVAVQRSGHQRRLAFFGSAVGVRRRPSAAAR